MRPVSDHGLGDELADQCPGEIWCVIAFAQEFDCLVGAPPGRFRIDGDLLKERKQDFDAQLLIVAGLGERPLLVAKTGLDRLGIRGEGAEQQERASSKRPRPARFRRPCRERSRTAEVASQAQGLGASQHPASEILRFRV